MEKSSFPFHTEVQALIAAHLLRKSGSMESYKEHLSPQFFSPSVVSNLLLIAFSYFDKYNKAPSEPVLRELVRQTYPKINNQADVETRSLLERKITELWALDISQDEEFINDQMKRFAQFCALRELIISANEDLKEFRFNPNLPEEFKKALNIGENNLDLGHDWIRQTDQRIREYADQDNNPRISTGLPHLDSQMNGGLARGELGILMALPKGFKSGTKMNFAFAALRQSLSLNVGYVSLELADQLVGLRFDQRFTLRTKDQIQEDPIGFTRLLRERQRLLMGDNRLIIKEFKTKTCTCDTIRAWMDKLYSQQDLKIDLLVVDYLDLLKPTRRMEKSYDEATQICEDLRSIASKSEYHIPIWTSVRANREAVGRKYINMGQMSKAFERIGVADVAISICQTEEEKINGDLRLYLAAMRNDGGEVVINCKVDYPRMRLTSVGISAPEFDDDQGGKRSFGGGGKKQIEPEDLAKREVPKIDYPPLPAVRKKKKAEGEPHTKI